MNYRKKYYGSSIIPANVLCIQYFGRWYTEKDRRFTLSQFSTAVFSFRGSAVSVSALTGPRRGDAVISLDSAEECVVSLNSPVEGARVIFEQKNITGKQVHNLAITALVPQNPAADSALEITGFSAEEPVDYPAELRRQMEAEYKVIKAGKKEWTSSDTWKPVDYKARTPPQGVCLLEGLVRTLFDGNIKNIKNCFSLPDYCEGEPAEFIKKMGSARTGSMGRFCWP